MKPPTVQRQSELTSLVISPNRELAQQFSATLPVTRAFHILAEMKSYPPIQTLDIRLRQLRPDLVFVDLASDLDQAAELIEFVAAIRPPVFVVGLHFLNDSGAILRSLRAGWACHTLNALNPLRARRTRCSDSTLASLRTCRSGRACQPLDPLRAS